MTGIYNLLAKKNQEQAMDTQEITEKLKEVKYISSQTISCAVGGTVNNRIPLLIEGDPGTGKTFLAKSVASMMDAELIRVQIYEGMTYDKILYDYDYQRQLLTIEAMRSVFEEQMRGKSLSDALEMTKSINFYGKDFLIKRPILKALTCKKNCVLLIDEIDKASEELEYTLLEVLDEFSMTIPQLGTVKNTGETPMVFLTSNSYRELSDALKRRCNYLYLERKTAKEMEEILLLQAEVDESIAEYVAKTMDSMNRLSLRQPPSVSEEETWAKYLSDKANKNVKPEDTLYMIAKNKPDMEMIKNSGVLS